MDSVDEEIVNEDYGGLQNRDARKRLARDKYFENREAAEIRELATAAVVRKVEEEEAEKLRQRLEAQSLQGKREKTQREVFIEGELARVRQVLPQDQLKSCVIDMVQVAVNVTNWRSLTLYLRFPDAYPQETLNIDIVSRTLSAELMSKVKAAAEKESAKHLGQEQVLPVANLVRSFMETNRLAPAYEDIKEIQALLADTPCTLKSSKEKTGTVHIILREEKYFLDLKFSLPKDYPERMVEIHLNDGNLPSEVQSTMLTQAEEKGRRLAEAPKVGQVGGPSVGREGAGTGQSSKAEKLAQNQSLQSRKMQGNLQASAEEARRKAEALQKRLEDEHVAKPSLYPVVKYLLEDCLRAVAAGKCLICKKRLIPGDPSKVGKIPKDMVTFRLYCGHMYHFKCVEEYLSSPPFGKGCMSCGTKIQHRKLVTNEKVLEQRWMQQEARAREIADVADFMSF
ncbi:hypothetical protein BSKO_00715 [Bryopsis sp. KO-2023]|nr:hypothetical protein BSKO_00715 [Bryopsis sp. KO-2023]